MYQGNYLAQHLRASSSGRDDAIFAVIEGEKSLSYGEFFKGAETYAAALIKRGVKPGDRVAVQVDKSIEVLKLYVGTIIAGGVFLPLNTAYTPAEIEYFLGDAKPQVFVCAPQKKDALKAISDKCKVGALETMDSAGAGSMYDLASTQMAGIKAVARDENDLAAILYTSGTTGRSKGAMLSHGNLWSNADTLRDYWGFSQDDRLIHALPIFHTHGLFVATNTTFAAGSSVYFMAKYDADAVLNAMNDATVLMGVPTFYVRLLAHPSLNKETTKNMRLFVSGSAPLLEETHVQWQEKTGHAILERYGMTETNMNTSNPYDGDRRAGTVGFPLPGVEVRIMEGETELPVGEIGSIEVRGPNVFQGYWQMPEKTKEELRDNGFFITGDLGMIDDRGYVSIIGRSKDLIITGGYNVYPKELELLIDDIDGVLESAVIGVAHPDFGEGVCAVVVPEEGATLSQESILDAIKDDLAKYKQPKKVFFVNELPRNTMGKVQKKELRDIYKDTFSV
ncbi:malonate--CoA ligase [Terasakiella pusilla]|uniref:malonate--CoA ligase n=1 Tax=Terasakiella pusilla TaxID=64973 RepID=UPI00048E5895|nr:malonyl-CoA synthase [Terasakiella pusilla]